MIYSLFADWVRIYEILDRVTGMSIQRIVKGMNQAPANTSLKGVKEKGVQPISCNPLIFVARPA